MRFNTKEKNYQKKYRRLLTIFIVFLILFSWIVYSNYDYLVFKLFLSKNYIYTETLDTLFEERLKRDVNGKYFKYFDDLVISTVTEEIREINNDRYTYLYIPEKLKKQKQMEKQEAAESTIKELQDDIVYLSITNFSKYTRKFLYDNINRLNSYSNIIIDLRDNYGGDIWETNRMVDVFLPRFKIIAKDKMRLLNWTYRTYKGQKLEFDNIVIIQNGNSASASESFIAALDENLENVTLIGSKTYGKGIGQFTMPLKRGFAVKATILQWFTPKGNNIHKIGISPDYEYKEKDIIDNAVEIINGK